MRSVSSRLHRISGKALYAGKCGNAPFAGIQRVPVSKKTSRPDDGHTTVKKILKGLKNDIHNIQYNEEERP